MFENSGIYIEEGVAFKSYGSMFRVCERMKLFSGVVGSSYGDIP